VISRSAWVMVLLFPLLPAVMAHAQTSAPSACKPVVLDVLQGEPVPVEAMLEDLAQARVIYLGEFHTIQRHHELQTEIVRRLSDRGLKLALGMEMFSESQQPALDHWQKGKSPIQDLVKELGPEHWTNIEDYQQVLTLARDLGVPIFGLNASDKLVRKVAREGLEGLTPSEKRLIPEGLEPINPDYDRLLRLRLKVHRAFQEKSLERIVLAQALRDETMARALIRALDSAEGKDRIMLVIAGNGHINYGFGIPERVRKLTSLPDRIVLPTESGELVLSEAEERQAAPISVTHEDLMFIRTPIADYLHILPLKESDDLDDPNSATNTTARP